MIRAVIFDYFGVISSDEYWKYVKHERWDDSIFQDFADDVNTGKVHWHEFVKTVASTTGTSVEKVNQMYASETINPLLVGFIHELHKNYKTGLITNANHEFIDHLLEKSHLGELFDSLVISSRVGIIKPDPRIFEYALKQLKVEPDETIYIDDSPRHAESAKTLGIHAILYQDFAQMKRDMDQILSHD